MNSDSNIEGLKEELNYLNNLSLTRIKEANVIWLTSLGTIAGLIGLSEKTQNWVFCYIALYLLPAFIIAIAWQLDGIARIRTYIGCELQPMIGGKWENKWPRHPIIKEKRKSILISVTLIFSWIYCFVTFILVYMSITYWKYDFRLFFIIYLIPVLIILRSLYALINSFSAKAFQRYVDGWKEVDKK